MSGLFLSRLFEAPWEYLAWVLIVMFSICVHEFAHAWTAVRRGDPTAAELGYLTLDPTRQLGGFSILVLMIFGLTWGAVRINPRRLDRMGRILVALSGPWANLILLFVFGAAAAMLLRGWPSLRAEGAPWLLTQAARANAMLALLNLLPLPGLDGWHAVEAAVPAFEAAAERAGRAVFWLTLIVVFFTPVGTLVWLGGDRVAAAVIGWLL